MLWRAAVISFVDNRLVQEGEEIAFTPAEGGFVAENLTPMDDEAQAYINAQKEPHPCKVARRARARPQDSDTQAGGEGNDTVAGGADSDIA